MCLLLWYLYSLDQVIMFNFRIDFWKGNLEIKLSVFGLPLSYTITPTHIPYSIYRGVICHDHVLLKTYPSYNEWSRVTGFAQLLRESRIGSSVFYHSSCLKVVYERLIKSVSWTRCCIFKSNWVTMEWRAFPS